MTRRKFLLSVTLMSTLTWLLGISCFASMWKPGKEDRSVLELQKSILRLFSDLDTPRILGNRYLDLYPDAMPNAMFLAKRIQSLPNWTSREIKKFLAQQRIADFLNDEIVLIDGWMLSRTELEVCALTVFL